MRTFIRSALYTMILALAAPLALADPPPNLQITDRHSIAIKGKINLYRVQIQGLELGKDREKLDAEVFVTLDSEPDLVMGIRYHDDSPPVNKVIAETLREAFLRDLPVTIYHQISPGKSKYLKIHLVQIER